MASDEENAESEIELMARAEIDRKKGLLIKWFAIFFGCSAVLAAIIVMRGGETGLTLDIESGEQEVESETNDPECRTFIAHVTAMHESFRKGEAHLKETLLSKDEAKVGHARVWIKDFRAQLQAKQAQSASAKLRYKTSRAELKTWFAHIDNELNILDKIADVHLEHMTRSHMMLSAVPDQGVAVDLRKKARKGKTTKDAEKTPEQQRDAAILTIHEDFASFRVWHSGGFHPCGKADPGEIPWSLGADNPGVAPSKKNP